MASSAFPAVFRVALGGAAGNTSLRMIARFATDVPTTASLVVIDEPGDDDVWQGFTTTQAAEN
ncbi:MAG TPA: hypothetical protein VN712_06170 [Dermatophilaceae bacterium]|nr:hypothetical protein [Dermatophilaceae bacterium]